MNTINIQAFAFNLATLTVKTRGASLPFHAAFVSADKLGQTQLRGEWLLGYIMGTLSLDAVKSAKVLGTARTERTKAQQAAYYRASADFAYHVIRAKDGASKQTTQKLVLNAGQRAAVKGIVAEFGSLADALAAVRAAFAK